MKAIENLKGWSRRHRRGLVLVLIIILMAEIPLGLWVKGEADRETTRLARYRCTDISCYVNQAPLVTCDQGTYDRAYRAEVARRQGATREKFGLTPEEAAAVVPYMGDWEGAPPLIEYWPAAFTPGIPGCIPTGDLHPEKYAV